MLTARLPEAHHDLERRWIAYDAAPRTLRRVVARAKQTARADARRRSRVANRPVAPAEVLDVEDESDDAEAPGAGTSQARPASRPAAGGSILGRLTGSFRGAYRRPMIREDLQHWRSIFISPAFAGGVALILAGGAAYLFYPGYSGSTLAFQYFVAPPPVGSIFIAGFFATRASYLMGIALGFVDVAVLWTLTARGLLPFAFVPYSVLLIPLNALFAGGVAFYRRFLASTSARRAAPQRSSARGKTPSKPARRR